jgi:hypothetical protein
METLASIRAWSQETIEDDSINDLLDLWANEAIQELEAMYPWPVLKATPTLTSGSTGILTIPSWIRTYNHIYTDPDTYPHEGEYVYRSGPTTELQTRLRERHYYDIEPTDPASVRSFDCYVAPGEFVVNQQSAEASWFVAGDVGKSVQFKDGRGFYEITAVDTATITINPSFRGVTTDDTTYGVIYVDHGYEERVKLFGQSDIAENAVDVQLQGQRFHPYLYTDTDQLLIEAPKSLKLLLQRIFLRNGKYDHDARLLDVDLEDTLRREIGPHGHKKQRNVPQNPLFHRGPRRNNYRTSRSGSTVTRPFS